MKKMKHLLIGICFTILLAVPGSASADVNDFTITSFVSDQTLSRNDPQGELHIIENIEVVYTDNNHGILRAIPKRYKGHSLQLEINGITSKTNAPVGYTTYDSNGNTVIKIGDPDKTVTGAQQYTIDYSVRNVITYYEGHDELYWDVNGDQWQQPFGRVSVNLHLPKDINLTRKPLCYSGTYGGSIQNCTVLSNNEHTTITTTQALTAYQTLTYVASFKKGYFRPSKWYETAGEYSRQISGFLLPTILIGGSSAVWWWRRGRDPNGKGTIIPQYTAPGGMKPMMVGGLIDFKVDNSDITAAIVDLAVRGYLKITETKKDRRLRKDELSYKLQLIKADLTGLEAEEKALIQGLFTGAKVGDEISITASKAKLYTLSEKLRKDIKTRLTEEGYLRSNKFDPAEILKIVTYVFGAFIFAAILWAISGGFFVAGIIAGVIIAIPFWLGLQARTLKGVEAKEHILGLKLYLETAEKDRLAKLQAPDAAYAANAGSPEKTVELFEKLLPYAMVLGVEKQWAGQFQDLYTTPPDWYSGNWTTFNSYYLASSLGDGIGSAVNTAFSPPSSSGSSGSGGGFSGGGGGGGGGGGW